MPVLPSYRSQLIDLLFKSINWFLYEGNTGTSWVNALYWIITSMSSGSHGPSYNRLAHLARPDTSKFQLATYQFECDVLVYRTIHNILSCMRQSGKGMARRFWRTWKTGGGGSFWHYLDFPMLFYSIWIKTY